MPPASISEYIRNVVNGVRSSCVTAETKSARRSLSANTPLNKKADAAAANKSPDQTTNRESLNPELA